MDKTGCSSVTRTDCELSSNVISYICPEYSCRTCFKTVVNLLSLVRTFSPGRISDICFSPVSVITSVSGVKHWSTYRAVSLKFRNIGTIPLEVPFVPRINDPLARIS